MKKVDQTVWRETGFIAAFTLVLSMLMEAVFLVVHAWDVTVLLGNLLGAFAAVLNFFLMGLTVQAATAKEEKQARMTMTLSQRGRLVILFAAAVVGVLLPCFHTVAVLAPLFFPRIAIPLRPFMDQKAHKKEGG